MRIQMEDICPPADPAGDPTAAPQKRPPRRQSQKEAAESTASPEAGAGLTLRTPAPQPAHGEDAT